MLYVCAHVCAYVFSKEVFEGASYEIQLVSKAVPKEVLKEVSTEARERKSLRKSLRKYLRKSRAGGWQWKARETVLQTDNATITSEHKEGGS